jgi:hypothetical protein
MTDTRLISTGRNPILAAPRDGGGLILTQGKGSYILFNRAELTELADVVAEVLNQPRIQRFTKGD